MSQPTNPYDKSEPAPQGMSGTSKVLLGLGIGCGLVLLLCCGGFAGLTFYWYNLAKNATSTDPATIRRVTDEIVSIMIPETLKPEMSMDMKIPFNQGAMQAVVYRNEAAGATLTLTQFTNEALSNDPNFKTQFETGMSKHKQQSIAISKSEQFETTINGQKAIFTISQGTAPGMADELWQVTGDFQGKGGPAILTLEAKSTDFTKDQVLDILKSMK
jgi:hypothetical protein